MKRVVRRSLFIAVVAFGAIAGGPHAGAGTPTAIYTFQGGADGSFPSGYLVADPAGNLYGVTLAGGTPKAGTVFELSPPLSPSTSWTKTVLYTFTGGADGIEPVSGLARDSAGNLYGTTIAGGGIPNCGGCGTAFKLSPPLPKSNSWTFRTIFRFRPITGTGPEGRLIFDSFGNLYGTTYAGGLHSGCCGVVFKLSPPAPGHGSLWTESVLYVFRDGSDGRSPVAGLTFDESGSLYGTASLGGLRKGCCGVAFKLAPPVGGSGPWVETVLHAFSGPDGIDIESDLVFDSSGNLYGAAYQGGGGGAVCGDRGCGTIFQLTPPVGGSGPWSEKTLHRFAGTASAFPFNVLVQDGKLYGSAQGGSVGQGVVFELSPTTTKYWTETETSFTGNNGGVPEALVTDPVVSGIGTFYGPAGIGGSADDGTIFSWTP